MRRDDLIRIRHMLESAGEAISFIKGRRRTDLNKDRMLVLSLIKSIEIMGANEFSKTFYGGMMQCL